MSYSILRIRPTEVVDGVMHYIVEIACDAAEDLPEDTAVWDVGSIAWVVSESAFYGLTSEGEWVLQEV